MFTTEKWMDNCEINATGKWVSNTTSSGVSWFREVTPGKTLYFSYNGAPLAAYSMIYLYTWDADRKFVERVPAYDVGFKYIVPATGVKYVRLLMKDQFKDKFQMEYDQITPYTPGISLTSVADILKEDTANLKSNNTKARGYKYALIGNSIGIGAQLEEIRITDEWFSEVVARLKGEHVVNAGVGGNTIVQMASRLDVDIIAKKPHICFVMVDGVNSLGAGLTVAQMIPYHVDIFNRLTSNGIMPIAISATPTGRADFNLEITKLNILISDICNQKGILFVDVWKTVVDEATGLFQAALTGDGLHPNAAGKRLFADTVYTKVNACIPTIEAPLITSNVDDTNLLTNGMFLVDTNSDGVPYGWTADSTTEVTYSIEADANIPGNWVKIVKTSTATKMFYQNITTGINPGDTINISGRFKTANAESTGMKYSFDVSITTPAGVQRPVSDWIVDITDGVFSKNFVVPTGATGFMFVVVVKSGAGTLQIGQVGVRNLTALGLA
jgi:lysophospholipase L1-like esterase